MEKISEWIAVPLGAVMDWCYGFLLNYGCAILLFTLISKIILLPISVVGTLLERRLRYAGFGV